MSKRQPKKIFSFSRPVYAMSLVAKITSFLLMGSVWSKGLPRMLMLIETAAYYLMVILPTSTHS